MPPKKKAVSKPPSKRGVKPQRAPRKYRAGGITVDSQWFRDKLAAKGMSIRSCAKLIDYDYSVLQNLLAGKKAWYATDVTVLSDVIGEPMEEIQRRAGLTLPASAMSDSVRVVGAVDSVGAVTLGTAGLAARTAPKPGNVSAGTVALKVASPAYPMTDGWLCYYAPVESIEVEAVNRLAIVKDREGREWLRWLGRNMGGRTWLLKPFAEGSEMVVEIVSANPILWIKA